MAKAKKIRVATPRGIAAYAWIQKPDTGKQFSNGKYKVTLVMPGDVDMSTLETKAREAAEGKWGSVDMDDLRMPWRNGDDHKNEEFHGKMLLNASSKFQPKTVDGKRKPLPKKVEVRSGDEVVLVVEMFPYEGTEKIKEGTKTVTVSYRGVSAQLKAVQLVTKNAGGGGLDLLDELEDGFDADEWEDNTETDDGEEDSAENADF